MTKLLVTGADGQLGRSLRRIFDNEPQLAVTYIDIDRLDLTDKSAVDTFFDNARYDIVINCAAYTAVDLAEKNEVVCSHINTDAVRNIAEAARRHQTKVIHISTDYVFNGKNFMPYAENDVPDPQSIYGRTKLEGEVVLKAYCPQSIIIRTSWLYSEWGNNFMKTMCRLGDQKQEIGVVCDQIGTPTYATTWLQPSTPSSQPSSGIRAYSISPTRVSHRGMTSLSLSCTTPTRTATSTLSPPKNTPPMPDAHTIVC